MRLFVRHSYLRQGQKEQDTPDFMALTTEERQFFMKGIATYMATKKLPNQIRGAQLNDAIEFLIDAIPDDVSTRSPAITGELRSPLKGRIENAEHGVEHVQTDVRTCGILVDDPAAPGTFRFGHKSFMEYLFSEVISDRITKDEAPDASAILNACEAHAGDIAHLPVSVKFLSELLGTNIANQKKSLEYQRALAKKILRLLLGGTAWNYFFGRLDLYHLAILHSSRSWPTFLRFTMIPVLGPFFFPAIMFCTIAAMFPILFLDVLADGGSLGDLGSGLLDMVFIANIFALGLVAHFGLMRRVRKLIITRSGVEIGGNGSRGAIVVWNRLCKELGLDDQVLFDISGIGWIPWTKKQPFDFFLGNGE